MWKGEKSQTLQGIEPRRPACNEPLTEVFRFICTFSGSFVFLTKYGNNIKTDLLNLFLCF
jgi:hypothetical protein